MAEALLSVLVLLLADCERPTTARCPPGWSLLEGVRASGEFACFSPAEPRGCGDIEGTNVPCLPRRRIAGRVYCTNNQQAIIGDRWEVVGCQARH